MSGDALAAFNFDRFFRTSGEKTDKTKRHYQERFQRLMRTDRHEALDAPSFTGYANQLNSRRSELARSSFQQYRAASLHSLQVLLDTERLTPRSQDDVRGAIKALEAERYAICPEGSVLSPPRTSALKQKRVSEDEWGKLRSALECSALKHASPALLLFQAGCESAWNKAPVSGVIGVQTGPL